jgi:type I site-specific restriction endonuclease
MIPLNLPPYDLKIKHKEGKEVIFDVIRKKYVTLTREEWVRQNFIHFLIHEKQFPMSLMGVEYAVKLYKMQKRADIVLFDNRGKPRLIVECKSPEISISQDTFDQAARYNISLKVDYLIVTNGLDHYCSRINYEKGSYEFLPDIPDYQQVRG